MLVKDELIDDMVADPDNGIVFLTNLKEKELLDLLFRLTKKAKSIRSQHYKRHGYLMDSAKVLRNVYAMNLHRWGIDGGISREQLVFFEEQFKSALCSEK